MIISLILLRHLNLSQRIRPLSCLWRLAGLRFVGPRFLRQSQSFPPRLPPSWLLSWPLSLEPSRASSQQWWQPFRLGQLGLESLPRFRSRMSRYRLRYLQLRFIPFGWLVGAQPYLLEKGWQLLWLLVWQLACRQPWRLS
jgi:hypothetical protein